MSRRPTLPTGRRDGFRGVGDAPTSVVGLEFTSASQYLTGPAWTETILAVLVRWVPLTRPANTFQVVVGNTTGAAGGFGLISEASSAATYGYETAYNGAYSSSTTTGIVDITQAGALGRVRNDVVRLVSGSTIQLWRDGKQMNLSGATAATSLGHATNVFTANRRSSTATLGYGNFALVEVRATTVALTDSQIAAWAALPVGTPCPQGGEVRAIVASDFNGSTIPPRVGSGTYAATGSPVLRRYTAPRAGLGTLLVMGDSIAAGRKSGGTTGDGWLRECLQLVNAGGRHITMAGDQSPTGTWTVDYSWRRCGVGGRGLGATPAAGTTQLSLVGTDRTANGGPDAIVGIAFGANDIYRRVRELAESPATCIGNMTTDWASYISGQRVVRTGPIPVQDTINAADSVTTADERTALADWRNGLPSLVSTWNGTYGSVSIVKCHDALVAAYGADYANNAAVLYDGTHPTPAAYSVMAQAWANALLALP